MENYGQLAQKPNGSSHLRYATERLVFLSHKSAVFDAGDVGHNGVADLLSVCHFRLACRSSHIPKHLLEKSGGGLWYRTGKPVHAHRVPSPSEPGHARRSGSLGSADDGDPRETPRVGNGCGSGNQLPKEEPGRDLSGNYTLAVFLRGTFPGSGPARIIPRCVASL